MLEWPGEPGRTADLIQAACHDDAGYAAVAKGKAHADRVWEACRLSRYIPGVTRGRLERRIRGPFV